MSWIGGSKAPPVTSVPAETPKARPPSELLEDLPRGNDPRKPLNRGAPSARFEQPDPSSPYFAFDPASRPSSLFLGVVGGKTVEDPVTRDRYVEGGTPIGVDDDRHQVLVAGSRSGKGRAVLIPNLLTYSGNIVATDPKGELATETAVVRKAQGHSVHILDPFGTVTGDAAEWRTGFNPIAAMRDDYLLEDAALIADALVVQDKGTRDPHWDESARAFLEGVILMVRVNPHYEAGRTLATVRTLIAKGAESPLDGVRSMPNLQTDMENTDHPVVQMAAADFFSKPDRERESVHSVARRNTKFLDFDGIQEVTTKHGFDLAGLRSEKTTVYLCLPARHMATCSRWLRLFVNLALQSIERMGTVPRGVPPILFVLDEFASLGHMRQLESAAAQIAGFGVKLLVVLQDLGQLETLYEKNYETFLGNAGVLQFFGNSDLKTLTWLSKRLGRTSVQQDQRTPSTIDRTMKGGVGAEMRRAEEFDLMYVDELARFFRRNDKKLRQLVIALDHDYPFILQRAFADRHHLFMRIPGRAAAGKPA